MATTAPEVRAIPVGTLPTPHPIHVVVTDGTVLAACYGTPEVLVSLLPPHTPSIQPLRLSSPHQRRPPTALALPPPPTNPDPSLALLPRRLCVASRDAVLLYDLDDQYACAAARTRARTHTHTAVSNHTDVPLEPLLLLPHPGPVDVVALTTDCRRAAICTGPECHVVDVSGLQTEYRLEGHAGCITAVTFYGQDDTRLITAAEDRSFHIWDLERGELLHRSGVLSSACPTALAVDPGAPRLAVGFADGNVLVLDVGSLPTVRVAHKAFIPALLRRHHVKAEQCLQQQQQQQGISHTTYRRHNRHDGAGAGAGSIYTTGNMAVGEAREGRDLDSLARDGPRVLDARQAPIGGGTEESAARLVRGLVAATGEGPGTSSSSSSSSAAAAAALASVVPVDASSDVAHLQGTAGLAPLRMTFVSRRGGSRDGGSGGGIFSALAAASVSTVDRTQFLQKQKQNLPATHSRAGDALLARVYDGPPILAVALPPGVLLLHGHTMDVLAWIPAPSGGINGSLYSTNTSQGGPRIPTASGVVGACDLCPDLDDDLDDEEVGGGGGGRRHEDVEPISRSDRAVDLRRPKRREGTTDTTSTTERRRRIPRLLWLVGSTFESGLVLYRLSPAPASTSSLVSTTITTSHHHHRARVAHEGRDDHDHDETGKPASSSPISTTSMLSMFPRRALPPDSPFATRPPPTGSGGTSTKSGGGKTTTSVGKSGSSTLAKDRPVTFHTSIKSSGYGLVHEKRILGKKPAPGKLPSAGGGSSKGGGGVGAMALRRNYPVECGVLSHLQPQHTTTAHQGAALRLSFAPDGSRLATTGADRTARALRLPVAKHGGEGSTFMGHNGAVTDVAWSAQGLVATASVDRSARIWAVGKAEPLLVLDGPVQNNAGSHGGTIGVGVGVGTGKGGGLGGRIGTAAMKDASGVHDPASSSPFYTHPVTSVSFLHLGRFLALSEGPRLHITRFTLGADGAKTDLDRLKSQNKYKTIWTYRSQAQTITDFAVPDAYVSHLVLCAGSSRGIEVVDLAGMRMAHAIPDCHQRPMGRIRLHEGSAFTSHATETYDLFATTAPDGCCRLWDLRQAQPVRSLEMHVNRQIAVGCDFSPCLRYLAVGSEDKSAYVYDLRTGRVVERLKGHGDAVVDVAYHPLHPQLATAGLDGVVRFYSEGSNT